jgi:hypothetical protein
MKHIQIEIRYKDQLWMKGLDFNESYITPEEMVEEVQRDWTELFGNNIPDFDNEKYSIQYFVLDLEVSE